MIAVACETLNRLFSTNEDRLIKQVGTCEKRLCNYTLSCSEILDTIIITTCRHWMPKWYHIS